MISIHNYLDALPFGFRANMIWVKLDSIHAEAQKIHLHVIKKNNRIFLFPVHITLDTPIYEQFWGMHIGSHINIWQALIVNPPSPPPPPANWTILITTLYCFKLKQLKLWDQTCFFYRSKINHEINYIMVHVLEVYPYILHVSAHKML